MRETEPALASELRTKVYVYSPATESRNAHGITNSEYKYHGKLNCKVPSGRFRAMNVAHVAHQVGTIKMIFRYRASKILTRDAKLVGANGDHFIIQGTQDWLGRGKWLIVSATVLQQCDDGTCVCRKHNPPKK